METTMFLLTFILLTATPATAQNLQYGSTPSESLRVICFGNYELINGQCLPCKYGQIALKGKCGKFIEESYWGSSRSGLVQITEDQDPNCKNFLRLANICLQCRQGYHINTELKKCVSDCLVYSEIHDLCLDNIDENIILTESPTPTPQPSIQVKPSFDFSYHEDSLVLLDVSKGNNDGNVEIVFEIPDENIQKDQNVTEILDGDNDLLPNETNDNLTNSTQESEEFPHCIEFRDGFCDLCEEGYLLNRLISQCIKVAVVSDTVIILPQELPIFPQQTFSLRVDDSTLQSLS